MVRHMAFSDSDRVLSVSMANDPKDHGWVNVYQRAATRPWLQRLDFTKTIQLPLSYSDVERVAYVAMH